MANTSTLDTTTDPQGPIFTMLSHELPKAQALVFAHLAPMSPQREAYRQLMDELKAQRANGVACGQTILDLHAEVARKERERAEAAALALETIKESAFLKTVIGKIQSAINEIDQTSVML